MKLIFPTPGDWWRTTGESAEDVLHIRAGVPVHLQHASLLCSADTLPGNLDPCG